MLPEEPVDRLAAIVRRRHDRSTSVVIQDVLCRCPLGVLVDVVDVDDVAGVANVLARLIRSLMSWASVKPKLLALSLNFRNDSRTGARKAAKLAARGVRRVFAIDVERSRALEWSAALGTWSLLDPAGQITDPT